jgi:predicted ATP-dependent endonuclease of OLD family
MHIAFVEIQNFRKLKAVRVDLHPQRTLFVGANNSGKTSAMLCLGHFLVEPRRFRTNDFTLSNWTHLNHIAAMWAAHDPSNGPLTPTLPDIEQFLPALDLWLDIAPNEVHHVSHLLPTLKWSGGLLGVRLRWEPTDIDELYKEFVLAYKKAKDLKKGNLASAGSHVSSAPLWPQDLREFLDRRLLKLFSVQIYSLDPAKFILPVSGVSAPQQLPEGSVRIKGDPLRGLIRIDEIGAQRGLGSAASLGWDEKSGGDRGRRDQRRLSEQLRSYYSKHLDPSEFPEAEDLAALSAIKQAQDQFDAKLKSSFAPALEEMEGLGYPGITDPRIVISTRLNAVDGLDHDAAVQYEVTSQVGAVVASALKLPEEYNGLGYQNLISMVFRLMSFRDDWMQVGKAGLKAAMETEDLMQPLHLVLIEEPEAHLHAQVQQVFIRKAYEILRKHQDLGESSELSTQLVVSTHSSHVAHECEFACLRYFRRRRAPSAGEVPTSTVVNLSEVFGPEDQTPKFVTRYLTATHSDLFFADAAIFVEGSAERMLVPHFVRYRFPDLYKRYITILELGGSHAHLFRRLVEALGLTTLIITDIDAVDATTHKSRPPTRGAGLVTANTTLKTWLPVKTVLDELLDLPDESKVHIDPDKFSVRVAYQQPVKLVLITGGNEVEIMARTFEDALVFENLPFFRATQAVGAIGKVRDVVTLSSSAADLSKAMHDLLKDISKAVFALNILFSEDPKDLQVPTYMKTALDWLQQQLEHKEKDQTPGGPAVQPPAMDVAA